MVLGSEQRFASPSTKLGFGRQNRTRRSSATAIVAVVALMLMLACSFLLRPSNLRGSIWADMRPFSRKSQALSTALLGDRRDLHHRSSAAGSLSIEDEDLLLERVSGSMNRSFERHHMNRSFERHRMPCIDDNSSQNINNPKPCNSSNNSNDSSNNSSNNSNAVLKVFMYALPPEFHFGMLDEAFVSEHRLWPENISQVPRYPGGLNLQHSIEYWLTLDLLFPSAKASTCCYNVAAVLVSNPKDADICFVPFFASLSYNKYHGAIGSARRDKNSELQARLVRFLHRQRPWQDSGGKNHVIVMHHPNSLHLAREQLSSAMFVVSDFGRYSTQVANVWKDVVAPYKHVVPTYRDDRSSFHSRTTLLYFQGAIVRKEGGMIRQQLYEMLKDERGVHFSTGNTQNEGIRSASGGMKSSKFCLHLAGDTPSSNRLFDAIASHCVPVVISDEIELPFEHELDYAEFCLFVRSQDALQRGVLMDLLHSVKEEEWIRMWMRLREVDHHFEFQQPSSPGDAVDMIWKSIAHKLPSVKQLLHKEKRYSRATLPTKRRGL